MKIRILEDADGHYMKVFGLGPNTVRLSTMFNSEHTFRVVRKLCAFAEIHYFLRVDGRLSYKGY